MNLKRFDERVTSYCSENKIQGIIRITIKDEIIYNKSFGYADIEKKTEFSADTLFSFYSLSKPFCAIGLLLLKDKGLVDIDKHPGEYLKEARIFDERLTIRHMLYHVSGLHDILLCQDLVERFGHGYPHEIKDQLFALESYGMQFAPGTQGDYNNLNFSLCALIIEAVSGMKYADYMRKEVFLPLGMKNAFVDDETKSTENRAQGHELDGDRLVKVPRAINWMLGGGDIVGTVDDVYRLNHAIKHRLLLKTETWDEVLTVSDIHSFGLGCLIMDWDGKLRVNHNGGHVGFRTMHFQIMEDDFDFIILSNSGFGAARKDIVDIVHEEFYGKDGNIQQVEMDKGYIKPELS